jgi:hypothetical protein
MKPQRRDLAASYRDALRLRPEERARMLRRLQDRLAGGEAARPELDVAPPALTRALRPARYAPALAATMGLLALGSSAWLRFGPQPSAARVEPLVAAAPHVLSEASAPSSADVSLPAPEPPTAAVPSAPAPQREAQPRAAGRVRASAAAPARAPLRDAAERKPVEAVRSPTPVSDATRAGVGPARAPGKPGVPDEHAALARDTLDEETRLLADAQLALRSGKAERALALLAEHTWRFPRGQLAEAREVAHVVALCEAGHAASSRAEAKRFLAKRPRSPFAERVRTVCAGTAPGGIDAP